MYVHVYTCTYMYIHVHTCTVGTYMYVHVYTCTYMYVYTCTYMEIHIYLKVTIIYGYKFERILKIVDLAGINFIENVR